MANLLVTLGPDIGIDLYHDPLVVGGSGELKFTAKGGLGAITWKLVDSQLPLEWGALTTSSNDAFINANKLNVGGYFDVTVRASDIQRTPVVKTFNVFVFDPPPIGLDFKEPWGSGTLNFEQEY